MPHLIKVSGPSQHLQGGLRKLGIRACTPTSLTAIHRFLTLAKSGVLADVNERLMTALRQFEEQAISGKEFSAIKKETEAFYKKELKEVVRRGVHMNSRIRGGFFKSLSRTDADQIKEFAKNYNLKDDLNDDQCEISELTKLGSLLAYKNTSDPECVNSMEALPPSNPNNEADPLSLPNALNTVLHLPDKDNVGIAATCVGHTTSIYFLEGYYYFINSAENKLQATLEIHVELESLAESLIETWGDKMKNVEFTQYGLTEDCVEESQDAAEAGVDTVVVIRQSSASP